VAVVGVAATAVVGGEEQKLQQQTKFVNLYVQLPNETMSELVRDYPASLFDRSKFSKAKQDEEKLN